MLGIFHLLKKFPEFYGIPLAHYRRHKSLPHVYVLRHSNPLHPFPAIYFNIHFNVTVPHMLASLSLFSFFKVFQKSPSVYFRSPSRLPNDSCILSRYTWSLYNIRWMGWIEVCMTELYPSFIYFLLNPNFFFSPYYSFNVGNIASRLH